MGRQTFNAAAVTLGNKIELLIHNNENALPRLDNDGPGPEDRVVFGTVTHIDQRPGREEFTIECPLSDGETVLLTVPLPQ